MSFYRDRIHLSIGCNADLLVGDLWIIHYLKVFSYHAFWRVVADMVTSRGREVRDKS